MKNVLVSDEVVFSASVGTLPGIQFIYGFSFYNNTGAKINFAIRGMNSAGGSNGNAILHTGYAAAGEVIEYYFPFRVPVAGAYCVSIGNGGHMKLYYT